MKISFGVFFLGGYLGLFFGRKEFLDSCEVWEFGVKYFLVLRKVRVFEVSFV